jgi:CBS domain-containing protein
VGRGALEAAGAGVTVSDLMEEPRSVTVTESLDDVMDVWKDFAPDPIPVIDDDGLLVGGLVLD